MTTGPCSSYDGLVHQYLYGSYKAGTTAALAEQLRATQQVHVRAFGAGAC